MATSPTKLTHQERLMYETFSEKLSTLAEKVEDASTHLQEHPEDVDAADLFMAAKDEFNSLAEDINNFIIGVSERLRGEWDDKSEKWQESETGESADAFITCWEELVIDTVDAPDECNAENDAVEFEGLPIEAE